MSWFADLAGRAETLLNNLDEQTGVALKNHNAVKFKKNEAKDNIYEETAPRMQKSPKKNSVRTQIKNNTLRQISEINPISPPGKRMTPASKSFNKVNTPMDIKRKTLTKSKKTIISNTKHDLDHCPPTLVGDEAISEDEECIRRSPCAKHRERRYSLPADLDDMTKEKYIYQLQNMEVENSMLKNELNVMNKEVTQLLERLRKTEDAVRMSDDSIAKMNQLNNEIYSELEILRKLQEKPTSDFLRLKENNERLEQEVIKTKESNKYLEDRIRDMEIKKVEQATIQLKIENDLRHAQMSIKDLKNELDKSNGECKKILSEWEAYKLRVVNMLHSKDNEIKILKIGPPSEDLKCAVEQLEALREERDEVASTVTKLQNEYAEMKTYVEQLETRTDTADRLVTALREALREERIIRNKAENDCNNLKKDLKMLQQETGQVIASLKSTMQEKDNEISRLKTTSTSSICQTSDSSALNVADFERSEDNLSLDKIQFLTNSLIMKQSKIDALVADNNMLKLQMEQLESKYKSELNSVSTSNERIGPVSDGFGKTKFKSTSYMSESTLNKISLRIGLLMRRHPLLRMFIIFYMVGLHIWVLLVLLTYTPEAHIPRLNTKT